MIGYRLRAAGCVFLMLALVGAPGAWLLTVLDDPDAIQTVLIVWTITVPVAVALLPVTFGLGRRMRLSRNDIARAVQTLTAQILDTRTTLLDRGTPWIDLSALEDGGGIVPAETLLRERSLSVQTRVVLQGERGAGKSLLLASLALDLLDQRTRGDNSQPIPVYLPLTQWLSQERDVRDWAIDAFANNALITQELAGRLIDTGQALLLLDGLDELRVGAAGTDSMERLLYELHAWERDVRAPHYVLACRTDVWETLPQSITSTVPGIRILPLKVGDIEAAVGSIQPATVLTAEILRRVRRRSVTAVTLLRSPWRLQVMLSLASTDAASLEEFSSWLGSRVLNAAALQRYVALRLSASRLRSLDPDHRAAVVNDVSLTRSYRRVERTLRTIARYLRANSRTPQRIDGEDLPVDDVVLHELWPIAGVWLPRVVDLVIASVVSTPGLIWLNWLLLRLPGPVPQIIVSAVDLGWCWFLVRTTLTAWIPPRRPGRRITIRSRKFLLQTGAALAVAAFCWLYFANVAVVGAAAAATWLAIGLTVGFGQTLAPPVILATVSPELPLRLERDISVRAAAAAALVIIPGFAFAPLWNPVVGGVAGIGYVLVVGLTVASAPYRRYVALILCRPRSLGLRPARLLRRAHAAGLVRPAGYAYQFRHEELRDYFAS